ncbi:hypothetical protein L209DRAFT_754577 [Thermothelomyces heterothallicus CBS 203.75]
MVLKRKRSESEFGSVFSSTERLDSNTFNFDALLAMDTARHCFFAQRLSTPSHLPSRTLKRFRDNRPSESEIYQHTLDVLYSAQRQSREHRYASPEPPRFASAVVSLQPQAQTRHGAQQRSLHSFWNLPAPTSSSTSLASSPASSAMSPPSPNHPPQCLPVNCEDCGARLGGDADDVMMDIADYGFIQENHVCGACGKTVCFSCSVSNLGEHRRCLACAEPRGGGGCSWLRR